MIPRPIGRCVLIYVCKLVETCYRSEVKYGPPCIIHNNVDKRVYTFLCKNWFSSLIKIVGIILIHSSLKIGRVWDLDMKQVWEFWRRNAFHLLSYTYITLLLFSSKNNSIMAQSAVSILFLSLSTTYQPGHPRIPGRPHFIQCQMVKSALRSDVMNWWVWLQSNSTLSYQVTNTYTN